MNHYLQRSTRKSDLPIPLDYRVIDVLLELCRKGELKELQELLFTLANEAPPSVLPLDLLTASKGKESLNNTLHMASANGHYEVARYLLTLLPRPTPTNPNPHKPHAFVAQRNSSGNTPLHWAALNGHLDIVKLLIERGGAETTVTNNAGHNVLFEAQSANKEDVAKFLLETCPELAAPIGRTEEVVMEGEGEGEGEGGAAEKGKGKETEGVTGGMGELEISAGDTKTNKAGNA
jgi:ankyrin repeat protein